jgi:hypothetical protein
MVKSLLRLFASTLVIFPAMYEFNLLLISSSSLSATVSSSPTLLRTLTNGVLLPPSLRSRTMWLLFRATATKRASSLIKGLPCLFGGAANTNPMSTVSHDNDRATDDEPDPDSARQPSDHASARHPGKPLGRGDHHLQGDRTCDLCGSGVAHPIARGHGRPRCPCPSLYRACGPPWAPSTVGFLSQPSRKIWRLGPYLPPWLSPN